MMKKTKSIIYVNYSPYENSGKILDFLLENFEHVFQFSLGFYNIKKKEKNNKISIFKKGKLEKEYLLVQLPVPQSLVFLLLPLRSLVTLVQIVLFSYWLKRLYGKIGIFFSVNAFTSWIGLILKKFGVVEKTVFWVWDYYPPIHDNFIIRLMRMIYWQFDKMSTHSDKVVFVNRRLFDLRKDVGILPREASYPIVPIGTDKLKICKKGIKVIFGFIGVIKKSQGLGMVFDCAKEIIKNFPDARYEIVGSGPDEEYFKYQAKKSPLKATYHGYLEGESFNEVLKNCTIGIATYIPDESNVSYYGDPGKIKRYLSLGIPVIATGVFEFADQLQKYKAGVIIEYNKEEDFMKAVKEIMSNYKQYERNALNLSKKFYYKKIYPYMFKF